MSTVAPEPKRNRSAQLNALPLRWPLPWRGGGGGRALHSASRVPKGAAIRNRPATATAVSRRMLDPSPSAGCRPASIDGVERRSSEPRILHRIERQSAPRLCYYDTAACSHAAEQRRREAQSSALDRVAIGTGNLGSPRHCYGPAARLLSLLACVSDMSIVDINPFHYHTPLELRVRPVPVPL